MGVWRTSRVWGEKRWLLSSGISLGVGTFLREITISNTEIKIRSDFTF